MEIDGKGGIDFCVDFLHRSMSKVVIWELIIGYLAASNINDT